MRSFVIFAFVLILFISCATSHQSAADQHFHKYQACVERVVGGRVLHDTGWVVAERDAETGTHLFSFLSTYWGRVVEVTRVNRFCNAIRGAFASSAEQRAPGALIQQPNPWQQ